MLGCNHDITVWIRKKIPFANKEIFQRLVLPVKCKWKSNTARNTNSGTVNIYNNVVIIIPYFDHISDLNIKEGDIAALGVYDMDITDSSSYTASNLKQLLFPNITTINSVSYNFDTKGKHLRLTGN